MNVDDLINGLSRDAIADLFAGLPDETPIHRAEHTFMLRERVRDLVEFGQLRVGEVLNAYERAGP